MMDNIQPKQPSNRCSWIRKELLPDSQEYLELKAACLRKERFVHSEPYDFRNYDNAKQIFLYEYHIDDMKEAQIAYQSIKKDIMMCNYKACIILIIISKHIQTQMVDIDDINDLMRTFVDLNILLQFVLLEWDTKKKLEFKILCC